MLGEPSPDAHKRLLLLQRKKQPMNLQNLQTMCLRPLQNPNLYSPENIICFPLQQQDAPVIKTKRLRPPAVIRNKADDTYHQCLTVSKAAELLSVSSVTIHRMLKSGRLHGTKDGRLIRVFQWSLDQYLIENTTAPENPLEPQTNKPKRSVKTTSHHVAMNRLESMGIKS